MYCEKSSRKKLRWILFVISIAVLGYLIQYIFMAQKTQFDEIVYTNIGKLITEPVTVVMKLFTILGSGVTILSIVFAVLCVGYKKHAKYMTINLIVITALNQLLKFIFVRPRPEEYRLVQETGYSFPSGHSMISMAFYGLIAYWIWKNVKKPILKWSLCILLAVLIIGIGISRIYLGVHYASDVIAGFCFSIAYLVGFTHLMKGGKEGETN